MQWEQHKQNEYGKEFSNKVLLTQLHIRDMLRVKYMLPRFTFRTLAEDEQPNIQNIFRERIKTGLMCQEVENYDIFMERWREGYTPVYRGGLQVTRVEEDGTIYYTYTQRGPRPKIVGCTRSRVCGLIRYRRGKRQSRKHKRLYYRPKSQRESNHLNFLNLVQETDSPWPTK